MEMQVFAVFDKKAELHNLPFFMQTTGEALRAFMDLVRDEKTVLYRHPEDFKLVRLGTFDNKAGFFKMTADPVTVAHADEFRQLGLGVTPIGLREGASAAAAAAEEER